MNEKICLPPINHKTYITVPPEKVYEMITTASGWDAWFTKGTQVDPRPGGSILFKWVNWGVGHYTTEAGGPILEAVPPRRFAFQWTPGDTMTTIIFNVKPLGPGTLIEVKESGHSTSQRDLVALVECASGWAEALTLLKMYLEHGIIIGPVPQE
jgi:uncharacterized protein YndB with AHSA1/START domain